MLNLAEHEISKLDKSNLINLLEKLLTCKYFHCFCLSNQSFEFNLPYILKDKLSFKVLAQTQLSTDSSFISTGHDCDPNCSLVLCTLGLNPLPDMPILGSSNSKANKYMMSKIWTNGDTSI